MMDVKPRPNQRQYLEALRRMTPAQRLEKSWELTEWSRTLFAAGMRKRHPQASESELKRLVAAALLKCHNRNY